MKTGKITVTALFLSVSFALSLLEGFVPISAVIPIPGLKLGFANMAVTAALFLCGKASAFAVVILRPLLTLLLFGNVTSFSMSLLGGIFSLISLMLSARFYNKEFTFRGISVISAVFHSTGQIFAACFVVADPAVLSYLPLLCAASAITGFLNGCVMNTVLPRIFSSGVIKNEKNI